MRDEQLNSYFWCIFRVFFCIITFWESSGIEHYQK